MNSIGRMNRISGIVMIVGSCVVFFLVCIMCLLWNLVESMCSVEVSGVLYFFVWIIVVMMLCIVLRLM